MTPIASLLSLASLLASSWLSSGTSDGGTYFDGLSGKVLPPQFLLRTIQVDSVVLCAALAASEKSHFSFTSAKECHLAVDTFDPEIDTLPVGDQQSFVYIFRGLAAESSPPTMAVGDPCPTDGEYFTHSSDCEKYFWCVFSVITEQLCAGGNQFDVSAPGCVSPGNYACPYE